jgi:hypothetical protein
MRIRCTAIDLLGFATNTYVTVLWSIEVGRKTREMETTNFKDVEAFILHHLTIIPQQGHA